MFAVVILCGIFQVGFSQIGFNDQNSLLSRANFQTPSQWTLEPMPSQIVTSGFGPQSRSDNFQTGLTPQFPSISNRQRFQFQNPRLRQTNRNFLDQQQQLDLQRFLNSPSTLSTGIVTQNQGSSQSFGPSFWDAVSNPMIAGVPNQIDMIQTGAETGFPNQIEMIQNQFDSPFNPFLSNNLDNTAIIDQQMIRNGQAGLRNDPPNRQIQFDSPFSPFLSNNLDNTAINDQQMIRNGQAGLRNDPPNRQNQFDSQFNPFLSNNLDNTAINDQQMIRNGQAGLRNDPPNRQIQFDSPFSPFLSNNLDNTAINDQQMIRNGQAVLRNDPPNRQNQFDSPFNPFLSNNLDNTAINDQQMIRNGQTGLRNDPPNRQNNIGTPEGDAPRWLSNIPQGIPSDISLGNRNNDSTQENTPFSRDEVNNPRNRSDINNLFESFERFNQGNQDLRGPNMLRNNGPFPFLGNQQTARQDLFGLPPRRMGNLIFERSANDFNTADNLLFSG